MPRIGILNELNPEQQDTLLHWMELYPAHVVVEKAAKAPPEGFGIETHITSLRRFHRRKQLERLVEESEIMRAHGPRDGELLQLESTTLAALSRHAANLALGPHGDPAPFQEACRWLFNLQNMRLQQQRTAIARAKLELEKRKFLDRMGLTKPERQRILDEIG